ncbi:HAMP domain-containing protein [Brevibacillus humidisoli]|uniref:ATP-binding protein n=1 Tax=Brevibacillus humidisoli TaxID=2895522 RepID=UPI001E4AA900|nr:ATP-binding protein [Brevibacillus humidisoli]UFJ39783.1 HAMP domain-containing protein [Brevibacillus humidisoli]
MSLFRTMGFQKKMMLSYFVMILLIGCVVLLFSYQMTKITEEEMYVSQHVMPQKTALLEVKNQLYTKMYALKMYISTREPSYLDDYYMALSQKDQLPALRKTEENAQLIRVIQLIKELDHIYLDQIDPLLQAHNVAAVTFVLDNEVDPRLEQLERELSLSLVLMEQQTQEELNNRTKSLRLSLIVTYTVSVLAILFSLFCVFYFRREMLRPIQSLIRQVRIVSSGTFGEQVNYSVKDEFFELAKEFNKMSLNIAEIFGKWQQQNQILEAEKRVREQILDSLPVAVITRHNPTSDVHINAKARELVQLEPTTFLPRSPDDLFWQSDSTDENGRWFENRKIQVCNKNGEPFPALVSYVPLLDQHRQEVGWMVVLSDITEQEKVQEYINQSEKLALAGQLAAGAAHEIRNPLTVIYGFMQLLEGKLSEQDQQEYHLPLILKEIERVNQIVTELLLLSKPSRPNYREVTLDDVLSSIIPLMKGEARLHNIEIVESYEKETKLLVDVEQCKQILLNLMKNAIEAMPNGGTLTIEGRCDQDKLYLSVTDTGVGISSEDLSRIFDPFFSLKEEGTGLGLPITMRMVKNHGGDLNVYSQVNRGTSIQISLPLQPAGTVQSLH